MKKTKNKLPYVIGGSGTIGNAIVKKFLDNGIKVINLDIKTKKKSNNNLIFKKFDLTKINQIERNLKACINKFGCPNILINSSYPITKRWGKINYDNLRLQDLRNNIDIHLNSTAWSSIILAKEMKKRNVNGSIIFINSIYSVLGQDKNLYKKTNININPVYSLIKSSLIGFSKNIASNYGEYGIRSNTIVSGGVEGRIAGSKKDQNIIFKNKYKLKTFLNRMTLPEDVSSTAYFLSTDESSYITGTEIYVDGGYSAK